MHFLLYWKNAILFDLLEIVEKLLYDVYIIFKFPSLSPTSEKDLGEKKGMLS